MKTKQSISSQGMGLIIFFLGIGLIILTFYFAYSVFTEPGALKRFAELAPKSKSEIIESITKMASYLVAAILLWIMGSISSRIAEKGLEMYQTPQNKKSNIEKARRK
ncbi:MAG: hypothetical protein ACLFUR_03570 [Candidatus Hadarchaeia archaeon]